MSEFRFLTNIGILASHNLETYNLVDVLPNQIWYSVRIESLCASRSTGNDRKEHAAWCGKGGDHGG
jgi:hypothetical protein